MQIHRVVRRVRFASLVRLLLALGLVLPLALGLDRPHGVVAASATVATDALNLRTGPGTTYDVVKVMYQGSSVTVLAGSQNGWYQVRSGSDTGWAFGDYLDLSGGGASGTATVATDVLNLRGGPSTNDSAIDRMYAGESVTVLDGPTNGGWYHVDYHGEIGWAFGDYLNLGGSSDGSGNSGNSASTATIATDVLNLRDGPGTGHTVLAQMLHGETVAIAGSSGSWYQVEYQGQSGWALGDYLAFGGDSASFWVPTHQQEHSLSCEYASLQIATAALGNEIPEDNFIPVVGQANNPHDGFRGNIDGTDIHGTDDYGVYPEALAKALPHFGFTGEVFYGGDDTLKARLKAGEPVLVWLDLWYNSSFTMMIDGQPVTMAPGSHVVVAYGYSDEGVLISDPDSSIRKRLIPWADFNAMWSSMDQMALAVSL